jgi:uncharacterized membrane protein YeaQ/YmgE (transglycosylase-associated protein family)
VNALQGLRQRTRAWPGLGRRRGAFAGRMPIAREGPCIAQPMRGRVGTSLAACPGKATIGDTMGWIGSIIIGGIVGWLASILMKTNAQMGIIANVIVGIVGSALGFWLAGMIGLGDTGLIMRWIISIAGAALLIFILKAVGVFK